MHRRVFQPCQHGGAFCFCRDRGIIRQLLHGRALVDVQLGVEFCKPCRFYAQLFLLREWLTQLCLCSLHLCGGRIQRVSDILQSVRHGVQSVVNTSEVSACILAQRHAMGHLPFERQNIIPAEILQRKGHLKSTVGADGHRLHTPHILERFQQRRTGVVLIRKIVVLDRHTGKAVLRMRMRGQRFHICLKAGNEALGLFNFLREFLQKAVLQLVLLALVVGFHQLQAGNVHIQIHLLFDPLVTGAQRLDLCIGKRGFVHILAGANRRF